MKIAYVILHYLSGADTIECVNSILESTLKSQHQTRVVVVDNGSTNDSYLEIVTMFENNNQVEIIHNEENIGFAKGNNIGFAYAKIKWGADFIVQLNNDTIVNQLDFNECIVKKFDKYQYGVLGPDIRTLDQCHQNPGIKVNWTRKKLFVFRQKKKIQYLLAHFSIFDKFLGLNEGSYSKEQVKTDKMNVQLHGACLIFSPIYIDKFDGMYDKTFLYMEEDILKLQSDYFGFLMMYSPDLAIIHKEDVATNMVVEKSIEKKKKIYKNLLDSSKEYIKLKNIYWSTNPIRSYIERIGQRYKGTDYTLDCTIPLSYLVDWAIDRFIMLVRGYFMQGVLSKHKKIFLGKKVKLKCKNKITFGEAMTFQNNVYVDALSKMGAYFGKGSSIGSGTVIRCSGSLKIIGKGFHIGDNSSLADNCFVGATGGVWIGDNVIGGQNIRFHSSNHIFGEKNVLIKDQGITSKGIYVGNNCWIGAGVVFCDGVHIGDGCVIGANSVVTKSFSDNCIIAGTPAKILGMRDDKSKY